MKRSSLRSPSSGQINLSGNSCIGLGLLFGLLVGGIASLSLVINNYKTQITTSAQIVAQQQSTITSLKAALDDSKTQLEKTVEAVAALKAARQEKPTITEPKKSAVTDFKESKPTTITVTRDLYPEELEAKYGPGDAALKEVLERVAINHEILVAVSNGALISKDGGYGILATWIESVRAAGITNFLVICLDDAVMNAMKHINVPYWRKDPNWGADKHASNHGISALKFQYLREFLVLGYNVFLSDVDIAFFKSPFDYLYRDSDVEGMSDGFDPKTAYGGTEGIDDPDMGWARYAQTFRIFSMNSGTFYLRANDRTINFMERNMERVQKTNTWDQTVYNEAIWSPSHGDYKSPQLSVRILDFKLFMNTKYLFKILRPNKADYEQSDPVSVHVNYHADKWDRMKAIIKRYRGKDMKALDSFTVKS